MNDAKDVQVWVPKVGELLYRHVLGVCGLTMTLEYRDREGMPCHVKEIARFENFSAGPHSMGKEENMPQTYQLHEKLIVRGYAPVGAILFFFRLWDSKNSTLAEWVEAVCSGEATLSPTEKCRIRGWHQRYCMDDF